MFGLNITKSIDKKKLQKEINEIKDKDLSIIAQELSVTKFDNIEKIPLEILALAIVSIEKNLNIKVYDEQIYAAIQLVDKKFIDMKTGEGKTIVGCLASIIGVLFKKYKVQIITANHYLAYRDRTWMEKCFTSLGIDVRFFGEENWTKSNVVYTDARNIVRASLFGSLSISQNGYWEIDENTMIIIDEADKVLLDDVLAPAAITKTVSMDQNVFTRSYEISEKLEQDQHYIIDYANNNVTLTEEGMDFIEKVINDNIFTYENIPLIRQIDANLKAKTLLENGKDYIVEDSKIISLDPHSGRRLEGKLMSGLQQALEIINKVDLTPFQDIVATRTFQSYFRSAKHLCGMSGTMSLIQEEIKNTYNVSVIEIPEHFKSKKIIEEDIFYSTCDNMLDALYRDIRIVHKKGNPILIGCLEKNIALQIYNELKKDCNIILLDAINVNDYDYEANIIRQAGKKNSIVLSLGLAGRGIDIVLEEESKSLGGLHIFGIDRNTERRHDEQLAGRCGRQGEPGWVRFYLALDYGICKKFGIDKTVGLAKKISSDKGISISILSKAVLSAQKQIAQAMWHTRRWMLDVDRITESQRSIIASVRKNILFSNDENILEYVFDIMPEKIFEDVSEDIYEYVKKIKNEYGEGFDDAFKRLILNMIDKRYAEYIRDLDTLQSNLPIKQKTSNQNIVTLFTLESMRAFQDMITTLGNDIVVNVPKIKFKSYEDTKK